MLVKLTEVCANGLVTAKYGYVLREVFINPEHVIMVREDPSLQELNENGKLSDGLDKGHGFSRLTISRGQIGSDITVVGNPELIEQALARNKKQLLKG